MVYKNSQFSATSDNPSFGMSLSCIARMTFKLTGPPHTDWFDFNINVSDQYFQRLTALAAAADIFLELGNTGTAVQRRWLGSVMSHRIPPPLNSPAMQSILPKEKMEEIQQLRHPDPKLVPKLDLKDERLQVRGSWKKVELKKGGGVTSRMGVACFVYKGDIRIVLTSIFLELTWWQVIFIYWEAKSSSTARGTENFGCLTSLSLTSGVLSRPTPSLYLWSTISWDILWPCIPTTRHTCSLGVDKLNSLISQRGNGDAS